MLIGGALSLAQPCHFARLEAPKTLRTLNIFALSTPRGIVTTDKGRYFSLIYNTCKEKKLKKFHF